MIIVTDPSDLPRITNPAIRELVALRLEQLHSADDDLDGEAVALIVVEARDSVLAIENAAGFPILTSLDDLAFDHPDFTPPFEIIEEHKHEQYRFYELYYVASDSGAGTAIFVPDEEGVDVNLLLMLTEWATPAVSTP